MENIVLEEQNLSFENGCSTLQDWSNLIEGKIYSVSWDGARYTCTAQIINVENVDSTVIGNKSIIMDSDDTNEPFLIVCAGSNSNIYTADSLDSHTIAIYAVDGIVLRDPLGVAVTYGDYKKIRLTKSSGEKVIFSEGEAVSKTVGPDFSGGDMDVPIAEGELVTELIITKPETLVPENIPRGMTIAGVGPGMYGNETEERTVDLDMSDGDQTVLPSSDDMNMSRVVIKKPDTLIPENIASGVAVAGIVGTHEGGGGSGGGITIKDIAERTIVGAIGDETVQHISARAFQWCMQITEASFPMCSDIGVGAFQNCRSLSKITLDFSNISTIKSATFYSTAISGVLDLPACSSIGSEAFAYCSMLTAVNAPLSGSSCIGEGAFSYCSGLEHITVSTARIPNNAFYGCRNLTDIGNTVAVNYIGNYAFDNCVKFSSIRFSTIVGSVGSYAFGGCNFSELDIFISRYRKGFTLTSGYLGAGAFAEMNNLAKVTFGIGLSVTVPTNSYTAAVFASCHKLSKFILKSNTSLFSIYSTWFAFTPIQDSSYLGYFGSIYVPSSKYDAFLSASGWSFYSNRMVSYNPDEGVPE